MHVPHAFRRNLPCNRCKYTYVKNVLGQRIRIQYEYIYVKNRREFEMYLLPRAWVLRDFLTAISLQLYVTTALLQGRPKQNHNHNLPKRFYIWCHAKTAFDGTSDEKSLWFICVPLCRWGIWCVIRGYPKMKNGAPRDEPKNGHGRGWVVPYFCWTKFLKKVAKFETKFPKFSPKFAPKFAPKFSPKFSVLSWQVEKSSPQIAPGFSHRRFQISNSIPNLISPKISQTHFCRLGSPNYMSNVILCEQNKNRDAPPFVWNTTKRDARL